MMPGKSHGWSALGTAALALELACRLAPSEPEPAPLQRTVAPVRADAPNGSRPTIPDEELIDQDGRRVHFYSDLIRGKRVLVNAIFTRCQATCPVQGGVLAGMQEILGERLGRDVHLVTVSLDPTYDTPSRMKEFGARHGARPGWTLVTGDEQAVSTVLKAMDLYAAKPAEHTPMAAIGNEPTGVWMKALNLTAPIELVRKIDYVASLEPFGSPEAVR